VLVGAPTGGRKTKGGAESIMGIRLDGGLQGKTLDAPDERRRFDHGKLDVVHLEDVTVGRATLEPGWRWSEHMSELAGTDSCEVALVGYILSGRIRIAMDEGPEQEFGPNEAFEIPPGHDAWVVGEEPCVMLDFSGADEFAQEAK
jgi:quercetin dioxygenase-like cupin family protein